MLRNAIKRNAHNVLNVRCMPQNDAAPLENIR